MCMRNKCRGCGGTSFTYCRSGDWSKVETGCYKATHVPSIRRKKCPACITIEGVITKLRNMVIQQPWLETEGVSGAENRPAWETEVGELANEHKEFCNAFWVREGLELKARLGAMGLDDLDGKENLMDGDGIATTESKQETTSEQAESSWDSGEGTMTSKGSDGGAALEEGDLDNEKTVTVACDSSV